VQLKSALPVIAFPSAAKWEAWLAKQPRSSKGLWLKLAKKDSGIKTVSRQEAIDGALCHGWIDGQLQKFDEQYWLVRFTPRAPTSKWSKVNRTKAQELIDAGRLSAAGTQEVKRAQADGRWEAAYPSQRTAEVPPDFQLALAGNSNAGRLFSKLDSANRYAILYRIHHTKTPAARAANIAKHVQMLARGETLHPRKKAAEEQPLK
jgi:uncharacterized protein YdeI (YjbR/CyaY-like superfamily)